MEAKELRIGNYVYYSIEDSMEDDRIELVEVDNINHYGINEIDDFNGGDYSIREEDYLRGIPLTEEWLIKFGFFEESLSQFVLKWQDNDNCRSYFVYSDWCTISVNHSYSDAHEDDYVVHREIEYVHQLQNLFFALTGEELTIKE